MKSDVNIILQYFTRFLKKNTMTYFVGTKYVTQTFVKVTKLSNLSSLSVVSLCSFIIHVLFVTLDNEIQWCKGLKKYLETSVSVPTGFSSKFGIVSEKNYSFLQLCYFGQ